jgi:hypothetical protein
MDWAGNLLVGIDELPVSPIVVSRKVQPAVMVVDANSDDLPSLPSEEGDDDSVSLSSFDSDMFDDLSSIEGGEDEDGDEE